ncbi:dTDP-4-dehydrorhamnose 3,5-epimerase [Porphyromonadaceae sp. NP-X]|jgi:dTDP-4-dehydrorhamnose 3,5-epimerase|nr:dTDP-4-dehydrorhamnose 3,5-epimerase [Paludibacteraceae bacterium]MBP9016436.1 dTDP-4-dehydrorhamnose 3,5-epimerase [Paludibacteraceae bacterium]MDS1031703.1 dTDP-4-dehydrorhamnose 3,5-epimerase [Porphyromonadaceae sp. NP-X]NLJ21055.1 dTDP-4-dehydrorhamnose 3,5-epimerase [Bacteroidales bacterium]HNZ61623.1 dTDP-4-dehydrorhamnose 3,5-epimerase [Paludibacteraceae bacterium]
MEIIKTPIPDLLIVRPKVFEDARGYFYETYNEKNFSEAGLNIHFCQDNQSKSVYGVIRGLHYQLQPDSQCKLVSAIQGTVWDVAVDLRTSSPTFGKWYGIELSAENHLQFLIPKGFAHGFSVLTETAIFAYKCDAFYNPSLERGILYNDPQLAIDWKIPEDKAIVSVKDNKHPLFNAAEMNF